MKSKQRLVIFTLAPAARGTAASLSLSAGKRMSIAPVGLGI